MSGQQRGEASRDAGISRVEALPKRYGPTSGCDTGNLHK
jgi:hypothetical protein